MKRGRLLVATTLMVFVLAACVAGENPQVGEVAARGEVAGFWQGIWHGFIAPVTFIIGLFSDSVNIYEVHNSGNWYDFGFVLGAGILGGGGATASRRR